MVVFGIFDEVVMYWENITRSLAYQLHALINQNNWQEF